jgi:hypothetical protein
MINIVILMGKILDVQENDIEVEVSEKENVLVSVDNEVMRKNVFQVGQIVEISGKIERGRPTLEAYRILEMGVK